MTRWVTNRAKAYVRLAKHVKSYWHLAATERRAFCLSVEKHGNVLEQIVSASKEERKQNREFEGKNL